MLGGFMHLVPWLHYSVNVFILLVKVTWMARNLGLLYQCPCIVMCVLYGFDALELFSNH